MTRRAQESEGMRLMADAGCAKQRRSRRISPAGKGRCGQSMIGSARSVAAGQDLGDLPERHRPEAGLLGIWDGVDR